MKKNKKEIILNNPFVFDIRKSKLIQKMVNQFDTIDEFKSWIKKNLGYDKWSYDGMHRYGYDSSTNVSDIMYGMVEEGMELFCYMKPKGYKKMNWYPIRILHKYHNIIFYQCLIDNYITYADCGADDYDWRKLHEKFEPALPLHYFAPIEVIVPDYVDVEAWCLPSCVQITNVKD